MREAPAASASLQNTSTVSLFKFIFGDACLVTAILHEENDESKDNGGKEDEHTRPYSIGDWGSDSQLHLLKHEYLLVRAVAFV